MLPLHEQCHNVPEAPFVKTTLSSKLAAGREWNPLQYSYERSLWQVTVAECYRNASQDHAHEGQHIHLICL